MAILADENTHRSVVDRLREAGYAVEWLYETRPGESDLEILERPDIATAILITNDRDFGDLIFNRGGPAPRTILYTRLPHRDADATANRLIALLADGVPAGQMITITKNGNRIRPFPLGASNG